jgi:hypothetical protein
VDIDRMLLSDFFSLKIVVREEGAETDRGGDGVTKAFSIGLLFWV